MPATIIEKLEWIEARRVPDYLYLPGQRGRLEDGREYFASGPRDVAAERREVQEVYRQAFLRPSPTTRSRVLKSYTANFPQLAFDANSWLYPQWQVWRAQYEEADRQMLAALARGISGRGSGWMPMAQARLWAIRQAKARVRYLTNMRGLKARYREVIAGLRSRDPEVAAESKKRELPKLLEQIERLTEYRTSRRELMKRKLSGVIRRAVSKGFRVPERQLH
jgi:hypothetical protein